MSVFYLLLLLRLCGKKKATFYLMLLLRLCGKKKGDVLSFAPFAVKDIHKVNRKERKALRKGRKVAQVYVSFAPFANRLCALCG
jgi:hypothetical protein